MAQSVSDGIAEKLRRAHLHREDFERRVRRFLSDGGYSAESSDDPAAGERVWVVRINKQPPLISWGALIGDCLFNFRSALDHPCSRSGHRPYRRATSNQSRGIVCVPHLLAPST